MEAVITIKNDFSEITLKDIKQALDVKEIKYGRYSDAILQCNLDQSNKKFIAAKQGFSLELIKAGQASYYFATDKRDTEIRNKGETLAEQHFGDGSSIKKICLAMMSSNLLDMALLSGVTPEQGFQKIKKSFCR